MLLKQHNGLFYLQFKQLLALDGLWHAVFTRAGGVSQGLWGGLNVGRSIGDDECNVQQNRRLIADCAGNGQIVYTHQVHGTTASIVAAGSLPAPSTPAPEGDALICNRPGVMLAIQVADCQPVLLFDRSRRIVANVHAGWRGSIQNVLGHTIKVMQQKIGCRPQDLYAGIGPSLGPCCGEFVNYRREIPSAYWGYRCGDHHFDFWSISRDQLTEAGVPPDHIACSAICTRCNPDLFFSYRRNKTTGRFAALIGLLPN